MATKDGVSEEMRTLYEAQRRAHDTILALQAQIEEEEAVYLEETPHGNIIRGWDGFIDSKQSRKDANPKKIKPYTESEHLFSDSCFYTSMADEPSIEDVDIYNTNKSESSNRRKLTVTLSVGGTPITGVVDSIAPHNANAAYRGGKGSMVPVQKTAKVPTQAATGKGAAITSYQHSKSSKLKKRKREGEGVATAKALETVASGPQIAIVPTAAPQPPASDFLDVL